MLKDWDPPSTCMTASVFPCVGRTAPSLSGIQSTWFLKTALNVPWTSGLHQTMPSHQRTSARSSRTLGSSPPASWEKRGRPAGSKTLAAAPYLASWRAASRARSRE